MSSGFYYSLSEAVAELAQRRTQQARVEAWWLDQGLHTPPFASCAQQFPLAIIAPQVATARFEDVVFQEIANRSGLIPVWVEYTSDRYVSQSDYKRTLLRRAIAQKRGRKGGINPQINLLADLMLSDGKRFCEIVTSTGENLVNVHHRFQDQILGPVTRFDISPYYQQAGFKSPQDYYVVMLTWYIAHGILFDDFHGGEGEKKLGGFTARYVEPAWQQVIEEFGLRPLIVRMPWLEELALYPANREWKSSGILPQGFVETALFTGF